MGVVWGRFVPDIFPKNLEKFFVIFSDDSVVDLHLSDFRVKDKQNTGSVSAAVFLLAC